MDSIRIMPNSESNDEERTRKGVRDAILSLSSEIRPCNLTVTAVCKKAGISRGTFYNYYHCIDEAVDDTLDYIITTENGEPPYRCMTDDGEYNCPYGICDIVLEHPEYGPLLFDEALSGRVVERISDACKAKYVHELTRCHDITPGQAGTIFDFQLNGCLAVNRRAYGRSPICIGDNRDTIGEFILAGLRTFGRRTD